MHARVHFSSPLLSALVTTLSHRLLHRVLLVLPTWIVEALPIAMKPSPSAERNKEAIAKALASHAPFSHGHSTTASSSSSSIVLEIASGTGQHVAHFAAAFPSATFQPTEYAGGNASPEHGVR